ncbi:TPA: hypothetical protein NJL94_005813 [Pseudomonas aeruginosa]|nr:hypothetical protein [Pseudomonas aeruginosa]
MTRTLTTEQLRAEMIEKIAVASGLRARDGRNVVAEAIYAEVVEPLLAANREAQPVEDDGIFRPGDAVGVFNVGCETCPDHLVAWTVKGKSLPVGNYWLYTAPPAPANAVAWEMRYWSDGYNIWGEWERITAEQHAEMSVKYAADNDYEFRVLYDAPPAPKSNAADWGIDKSTGTPILVYKNCSVIESEQAHYVLSLINSSASAPAVPDAIITAPIDAMRCGPAASYVLGWNACRAAMLAAAPGES